MSNVYLLTNNQHGDTEEITCESLLSGLVIYGQHVKSERDALVNSTPSPFGNRYFFVAIYEDGKQLSWTIRSVDENGGWEETTAWKFTNAEDELTSSTGTYVDSGCSCGEADLGAEGHQQHAN